MTQPRLLDQVRQVARLKHLSLRTEESYIQTIRRFILFHALSSIFDNKRHPADMGVPEIRAHLSHLAIDQHVAVSLCRLSPVPVRHRTGW